MSGTPQRKGGGGKPTWRTYRQPDADEVEREDRDRDGHPLPRPVEVATPPSAAPARSRGRRWAVVAVATAVVAGGAVFLLTREGGPLAAGPEPYPHEETYQPILTADGLDRLLVAMREQVGSTEVLDAWFEGDDEIRFQAPPGESGDLAGEWRWDGTTLEQWAAYTPDEGRQPFDLADVDPTVLVELDEQARDRSDGDISRSLAHVERPRDDVDHWIYLKVTEVDHGGVVLWSDLAGEVEDDLTWKSWRDD
ncbi:hypothetical protein [Nocardioides sp. J54]|uniref:hypothetical protein n=1 Tax=Nocardioides sp. J54 TaxID=935866 RepID=UPI000491E783|nr:hypothetical protein [Nocardioides sp. J54]